MISLSSLFRVIFLTGPPLNMSLDWPPQKTPRPPPPPPHFEKVLSMAAERGEIPITSTFLIPRGASLGLKHFFEISHLLANT